MNTHQDIKSNQPDDTTKLDSYTIKAVSRRDFLFAGAGVSAGLFLANGEAVAKTHSINSNDNGNLEAPPTEVTDKDREFMQLAIQQMRQAGIVDKTGGPFGAVIVRDGEVLSATGNSVMRDHDPTAHAEVNAIRMACRKLATVDLSGAILYTSCECCPMCYATAYWARISKIYYAATWSDYNDLFDDSKINQDMAKRYSQRSLAPQKILQEEAQKVWKEFRKMPDGARY